MTWQPKKPTVATTWIQLFNYHFNQSKIVFCFVCRVLLSKNQHHRSFHFIHLIWVLLGFSTSLPNQQTKNSLVYNNQWIPSQQTNKTIRVRFSYREQCSSAVFLLNSKTALVIVARENITYIIVSSSYHHDVKQAKRGNHFYIKIRSFTSLHQSLTDSRGEL